MIKRNHEAVKKLPMEISCRTQRYHPSVKPCFHKKKKKINKATDNLASLSVTLTHILHIPSKTTPLYKFNLIILPIEKSLIAYL
jgi:hypothetical protein